MRNWFGKGIQIRSVGEFFGKVLSFLELVLASLDFAIVVDGFGDLLLAIGVEVLLGGLLLLLSVLHESLGGNSLSRFLAVLVAPEGGGLNSLALFHALVLLIDHHLVQVSAPLRVEEGLEVILEAVPPVSEEIVKYAVGSDWDHRPEENVVVVLSSHLVADCVVSLIHLHEFLVGFLTSRVGFWVVFQGQFPVGLFDLIEICSFADSEDLVGIVEGVGEVLIEELFLLLVQNAFLVEEPIEGGVGIFKGVLPHEKLVVLGPLVPVGEDLESFSDFVELGLG